MVLAPETVTAEGALKLAVAGVYHIVPFEVFACWKPFVTLAALESFLTGMSFGSLLTRNLHFYKTLLLLLFFAKLFLVTLLGNKLATTFLYVEQIAKKK